MRTLNLGILAHVDAGKTSLTERLLYTAGVIDEIGSVDDGSTQTDTIELERQRGITIKSAVASFVVDDVIINLIDTPGHPDFIAEVERVLTVLDGAVLVVSAVEGVQAQSRLLMRALQRLHVPTLNFVNKVDRGGADIERVLRDIADNLVPAVIPMGTVSELGTRGAEHLPYGAGDADFTTGLVDLLVDHDDRLLADFVDGGTALSYAALRGKLAAQVKRGLVHPVFFGSAITGTGVDSLVSGIQELLPASGGDVDDPVSGTVFKVERGPAGERIALVRMFSGTLRVRDRLIVQQVEEKVTAIRVFEGGSTVVSPSVAAGRIGKIWGLGAVRIGDAIGTPRRSSTERHLFSPPMLETVVVPGRPVDRGALHVALAQLAEQDPLINVRQDDVRQEMSVSLYGEVQKEVIAATLANDFGVQVTFRDTATICIERPVGTGAAAETIATEPNPFLATVGLRVDPAPVDTGVEFRLEVELGSLPPAFFTAVEQTVHQALQQGICGWRVTDCTVTMTHSGYWARQSHSGGTFDSSMSSTAGDFRNLTPLILMCALKQARTRVCEPIHRFHLEVPEATLAPVLTVLARLRGLVEETTLRGSSYLLGGEIPAARVHDLRRQLPSLTGGLAVLDTTFASYQPVTGTVPSRKRTDHNPLNRREYLLHVSGRL